MSVMLPVSRARAPRAPRSPITSSALCARKCHFVSGLSSAPALRRYSGVLLTPMSATHCCVQCDPRRTATYNAAAQHVACASKCLDVHHTRSGGAHVTLVLAIARISLRLLAGHASVAAPDTLAVPRAFRAHGRVCCICVHLLRGARHGVFLGVYDASVPCAQAGSSCRAQCRKAAEKAAEQHDSTDARWWRWAARRAHTAGRLDRDRRETVRILGAPLVQALVSGVPTMRKQR